jgi:hypothetical protein
MARCVLDGASAVVDGATLANTGTGCAIFNQGSERSVSGSQWDAEAGPAHIFCSNSAYGAIYLYGGTLNIRAALFRGIL